MLTLPTNVSFKDHLLQPVWRERRKRKQKIEERANDIFYEIARSEDGTEDGGRIRVVLYLLKNVSPGTEESGGGNRCNG